MLGDSCRVPDGKYPELGPQWCIPTRPAYSCRVARSQIEAALLLKSQLCISAMLLLLLPPLLLLARAPLPCLSKNDSSSLSSLRPSSFSSSDI